jgi:hypothetical protein
MFRAFFLAVGIYAFILGLECLFVDKAVLQPSRAASASALAQQVAPVSREITPAEWAPWSLLSAGAVVMLYSFTLPAKMRG